MKRTCVCVCVWACVRACAKLLPVGPSRSAEVGAIICSAVISINTFLDAHTLSQRSCAQHPPEDVTCSLQTHDRLAGAYHNTAVRRITAGPDLEPRGAQRSRTGVAAPRPPRTKHLMIYYTAAREASGSYHARLITG